MKACVESAPASVFSFFFYTTLSYNVTIMLLHVLLLLLTSSNVHAVMNGNYILKSDMPNHPFRGAVQSGGGSGLIITTENDEAVVFTVAHGYDLKYTDPDSTTWMELMDYKKNSDSGLANAYGGNVCPALTPPPMVTISLRQI